MKKFTDFDLPELILNSLAKMGFETPTPVQEQAIPVGLTGTDVLASAQTGTGKTIAYLLPLITTLLKNEKASALVLLPTRELATQVKDAASQILGAKPPFSSAVLIGGEPMGKQYGALRKNPRLIIATPGRLSDHLRRDTVNLSETRVLVLDETDRMLDMGFSEDLEFIEDHIPEERQTLLFSATMAPNIIKLSLNYLNENHQRIALGSTTQPSAHIKQSSIQVSSRDKYSYLVDELEAREGSVIIFVKTKRSADQLAVKLKQENHNANAIHGDLRQRQREHVIYRFRNNQSRILVATDVAARGLDIPHVKHVINYDLPQCPEDYIHRIGRTGRAGMSGEAISLIAPDDHKKWKLILKLINPSNKNEHDAYPKEERGERKSFKRGDSSRSRFDRPSRDRNNSRSERAPFGESRRSFREDSGFESQRENRGSRSERSSFGDSRRSFKKDAGFEPQRENRGSRSERSSFGDSRRSFKKDAEFEPQRENRGPRSEHSSFGDSRRSFKKDSEFESQRGRKSHSSRSDRSSHDEFQNSPNGDFKFEKSASSRFSKGPKFEKSSSKPFGRSSKKPFKSDTSFSRDDERKPFAKKRPEKSFKKSSNDSKDRTGGTLRLKSKSGSSFKSARKRAA